MKVSEKWLREFCDPDVSCEQMAEQLTMAGLEVVSIDLPDIDYNHMVVAEVKETEKHPDADKLTVCKIDAGTGDLLQVICGAANVRQGLKVVLANVGAKFPNLTIKKAKLRGVESNGMLCSEKELGLADDTAGIMELPADAPIGVNIADYLQLNDKVILVSITPNRGDCTSALGLAREVSALNALPISMPEVAPIATDIPTEINIAVDAAACPAYFLREISHVDNSIPTPMWMQQRLRQSDIRPISVVVDILNYVMIELGQPMHAFDKAKLGDSIEVRFARQGESVQLLDDSTVELSPNELIIADENHVHALAGVMGGLHSSVDLSTSTIVIESAHFSPEVIAQCVRRLGIHSDSSYRFERGVDTNLPLKALDRASALIAEITGGTVHDTVQAVSSLDSIAPIGLDASKLDRLLGIHVDRGLVQDILEKLSMEVSNTENGWEVIPPSYRFDIRIEQDLIEEVARIYGYNNIPELPGYAEALAQSDFNYPNLIKQARHCLANSGYSEVITYSFVSSKHQQLLFNDVTPVVVNNPISSDMNVMRSSLWPGLIQALSHNQKRQQERVRLFEIGKSFKKLNGELLQYNQLSGIASGSVYPEQWGQKQSEVDFFDVKGDVITLLSQFMDPLAVEFKAINNLPALHPGQAAELILDGQAIGFIGSIHPQLMKKLGLKHKAVLFEVNIDGLIKPKPIDYHPISKFPTVRRDIALMVNGEIAASQLINHAYEQLGSNDLDIQLFDLYEGEGIPDGNKSMAISFTFTSFNETLTDEAVAKRMDKVLNSLRVTYGVELRE